MNKDVLIVTIYSLFIVFITLLISVFIILPIFSIKEIELDSSISFSRDIESIIGLDSNSSYLFIDSEHVEHRLLAEPLVRKVYVEKVFPNKLEITVFGRKALAIAYMNSESKSEPICFDENGVVFQVGEEVDDVDLPVISGDIDFNKVSTGGVLPKVFIPVLKSLKEVRGEDPKHYSSISEITVKKKGEMTFDLMLHFTFSPIKALIRDEIDGDSLKNIIVVISLLDKEKVDVEYVDFREDEIVYRERS